MDSGFETFRDRIDDAFEKYSSKTAICYLRESGGCTEYTFGNLLRTIRNFSKIIEYRGLREGDRVAIVTPHSPYGIVAGISLAYWHLTAVLIDASLPAEEIGRLLTLSDVRAVLTVDNCLYALPTETLAGVPVLRLDAEDFSYPVFSGWPERTDMPPTPDPDGDVISILFSSGTTSQMKGVLTTYGSTLLARDYFADLAGLTSEMTYLLVLPFNHVAGFTGAMTYLLTGCTLGLIENVNASKLQKGLLEFQPSYFAMVPKVYEVMAQRIRQQIHEKGRLVEAGVNGIMKLSGFLRKNFGINIGRKLFGSIVSAVFGENIFGIGTGASPCSEDTSAFFLNMGLEWANLYATTETGVPITATGIHDRYPTGTVGSVHQFDKIQIKINAPNENGEGEIYVRSPLMMKGYFRDPEATELAFEDGYFKTGDIGYIDGRGYLYVTGRNKETILLHTGKKASPADLDKIYQELCPDNCVVACCGIPVKDKGYDEIHLFVEAPGLSDLGRVQLERDIAAQVAKDSQIYPVKKIHFIEKLPMTSVGKVKRYQLKELIHSNIDVSATERSEPISRNNIEDVYHIISEISGVRQGLLRTESRLKEELGMDSLTLMELSAALEQEFSVKIGERIGSAATIQDVMELIIRSDTAGQDELPFRITDYPVHKTPKMLRNLNRAFKLSKLLYPFTVVGEENIPTSGNYLICANHASYFDPIWIGAAMGSERVDFQKFCCLAAKHTMEKGISKHIFDMLGGIPVHREGNTIPSYQRSKECLEAGYTMIIFPEGARSRDGSMLPFKLGAAQLAIETGLPILPVRIDGSFEIFPRHTERPKLFDWKHLRRYRIRIVFGAPIYSDGSSAQKLTLELKKLIEGWLRYEHRN